MKAAVAPPQTVEVKAAAKRRGAKTADAGGRGGQNSYERIQAAALWLFAIKGVDSSSIRDIGARAKVPTSLLYHYAPSKSQLLFELMDDGLRRHLLSSRSAKELGSRSPEGELVALVVAHVHMHGKNRLMARVVTTEWRTLPKKQQSAVLSQRDEISALWDAALARGVKERVFDVKDVKLTRLALIQMCGGVSDWFSSTGPKSIEALATDFAELALSMVRASRDGKPLRLADVTDPDLTEVAKVVADHHVGAVRETRL